ncbi:hypothetical protein HK104_000491 [Borealophlyctis nickersoniae]|nr:hypothetical protein HK104_000491 [Borealophlyctis nickersoniae]
MDLGDSSALQAMEPNETPSPVTEPAPPAPAQPVVENQEQNEEPQTPPVAEATVPPTPAAEPVAEPPVPVQPVNDQQPPQPTETAAPAAERQVLPQPAGEVPEVLPVLQAGQPIRIQASNASNGVSRPVYEPAVTDTSVGPPAVTELPGYATPSPYVPVNAPHTGDLGFGARIPPPLASRDSYSSDFNAKSKAFNQRLDYMIGEFFSRQVTKLATSTPESVDRNYRIFHQRMREKLGQQWAHITAQPEVDEAVKQVQAMHEYFSYLEKMVEKQRSALQMLNEVEAELSLFYQQKGYQEEIEDVGRNLVHLGINYHSECKERGPLITSLEAFLSFIKTFNNKAIGDLLDTIKRQSTARQELDSYGSKLGSLEEKKIKAMQKTPITSATEDAVKYQEKELQQTRARFQTAKERYQTLSTQVIDKTGLLQMKREVDFASYLDKLVEGEFTVTKTWLETSCD